MALSLCLQFEVCCFPCLCIWLQDSPYCLAEIRNGNLKAILGLFFSLSRYKQQQQQQPQKQHLSSSPLPPAGSQVAGAPSQCQAGIPQQQGLAAPQAPCQPLQPASHQQAKTQAEMQSRWALRGDADLQGVLHPSCIG